MNNETVHKVGMKKYWKVGFNPFFILWTMKHILTWLGPTIVLYKNFSQFSLSTEIDIEVIPMDSSGTSNVLKQQQDLSMLL